MNKVEVDQNNIGEMVFRGKSHSTWLQTCEDFLILKVQSNADVNKNNLVEDSCYLRLIFGEDGRIALRSFDPPSLSVDRRDIDFAVPFGYVNPDRRTNNG